MYRYIQPHELEELVLDNRQAWIVYGVTTKDKEEYIMNLLITLKNIGFNTSLLTQCKVFKTGQVYNFVLTLRKNAKVSMPDSLAISKWVESAPNIMTVRQYMHDRHKLGYNRIDSINCIINTNSSKRSFGVSIRFTIDTNDDIINAMVISPKFMKLHGYEIDTSDCKHSIPKIVEKLYAKVYKDYKYHVVRCNYKVDGKLLRYNVVPTPTGIKLELIK